MKNTFFTISLIVCSFFVNANKDFVAVTGNDSEYQIEKYKAQHQSQSIHITSCSFETYLTGNCLESKIKTNYEDVVLSRGWSIMVLDPDNFTKKDFVHYDNHLDYNLTNNMEAYLNTIKDGDLVLIGTFDQPAYITDSFIATMGRLFNADTAFLTQIKTAPSDSTTNGYRSSYALVAYKNGVKKAEDIGMRYFDSIINIKLPN